MGELDDELAKARRRVAELEAAQRAAAEPQGAAAAPVVETKDVALPIPLAPVMVTGAVVLSVIILAATMSKSEPETAPPPTAAADTTVDPAEVKPLAPANAPVTPWTYDRSTDEMTGKTTETACTMSVNKVSLGWPYGERRGRLCLRRHPTYGLDVIVSLEGSGQILCRAYDDCTVRVRFDQAQPVRFPAVEPSDGSSDAVFIRREPTVIDRLRASEWARVELEFFQAGQQSFEFRVAKLEWPIPKDPGSEPPGDAQ